MSELDSLRKFAFVVLILTCPGVGAQFLNYGTPSRMYSEARIEALTSDLERSFDEILEEYDRASLARPFDIVLKVDRCRFIEDFSYTYEYLEWIDRAYELSQECKAELEAGHAEHPEVVLYGLEYLYGEELLQAAAPYERFQGRTQWTQGQGARLYELAANAADSIGSPNAGIFALRALELDQRANVRLIAASSLIDQGNSQQAIEILSSPFDQQDESDAWYASQKMRLLALAGDTGRVLAIYDKLQDSDGYYSPGEVAQSLREIGEYQLARTEFQRAADTFDYFSDPQREIFEMEMAHGTGVQALAAYDVLRSRGWSEDPLGINRVALFLKDPTLPLEARDLLGVVGLLGSMLLIAGISLVPVAVVHYRGLAIRVRNGIVPSVNGWRLRHAWYALFAILSIGVFVLYGRSPVHIDISDELMVDTLPGKLAWMSLMQSVLTLLVLVPLAKAAFVRELSGSAAAWSITKCFVMAILAAFVLRLPLFISLAAQPDLPSVLQSELLVWEMLALERDQFGVFTAMWVLAAVAPLAEEFLFRGVLLRAFSKHVSFGLANTIQAGLFALVHLDAVTMPWVFVLGLVAGVMAKRSGGLVAPIIFHSTVNLIAGIVFLI